MIPARPAQRYVVRTNTGVLLTRCHDRTTADRCARNANERAANMGLLATTYEVHDLGEPDVNGRYTDPDSRL